MARAFPHVEIRALGIEISLRLGVFDRADSEARALGLCDPAPFERLPSYLTWEERIGAALLCAQLCEATSDGDRADAMVEVARSMLTEVDVPRLDARLAVIEARLSYARGDKEEADRRLVAARELYKEGWPIRYFLDGRQTAPAFPPTGHRLATDNAPVAPMAVATASRATEDPLTARERQILLLLGEGHQNKVAAHRLGLSEATVKFHLRNIYRKLHAQNRTQALARYRSFVDVRTV